MLWSGESGVARCSLKLPGQSETRSNRAPASLSERHACAVLARCGPSLRSTTPSFAWCCGVMSAMRPSFPIRSTSRALGYQAWITRNLRSRAGFARTAASYQSSKRRCALSPIVCTTGSKPAAQAPAVLEPGDPAAAQLVERGARPSERDLAGVGSDELGQALAGATDEHPRWLAPAVPLHAAAPRVRRAPADPRSGERERVGDVGAVDAANKDRVIGRDRIQGAAVDGERRRPGLVSAVRFPRDRGPDVATRQPHAGRNARDRRGDLRQHLSGVALVVEADPEHPCGGVPEVRMRIDEARQRKTRGEVDDLGARAEEGRDIAVRADGDDPVAAERDRARFRPSRVDGPDATAAEDEVGGPGRVQPMRRRALRPARYRLASTSARTRPSSTQPEFSLMMSAPECAITQVIARATIAPTAS